jgi:hypothetical protein
MLDPDIKPTITVSFISHYSGVFSVESAHSGLRLTLLVYQPFAPNTHATDAYFFAPG